MRGVLAAIVIGERGERLRRVARVEAVAGRGLVGDRYYEGRGTFDRPPFDPAVREISVMAMESVAQCNARLGCRLDPEDFRRNLLVAGLDVMALVGRRFAIGEVLFRGVRTAPPCRYLSRLVGEDMMTGLRRIGGIRAVVERGGVLETGEAVVVLD
ncbi:MOSC domain-containing protein [Hydrogenimonas sp.]